MAGQRSPRGLTAGAEARAGRLSNAEASKRLTEHFNGTGPRIKAGTVKVPKGMRDAAAKRLGSATSASRRTGSRSGGSKGMSGS